MSWIIIQDWMVCWFCLFQKERVCLMSRREDNEKQIFKSLHGAYRASAGSSQHVVFCLYSIFISGFPPLKCSPFCSLTSVPQFVSATIWLILCHGRYFPLQITTQRSNTEHCVLMPKLPWPLLVFHIICPFSQCNAIKITLTVKNMCVFLDYLRPFVSFPE